MSITEICKKLGISRASYYNLSYKLGHYPSEEEIKNRAEYKCKLHNNKKSYYSYKKQFKVVFCFLNLKNMVESDNNGEIYYIEIVNAKDTEMARSVFIKQFENCKIQPEIIEIVRIKRKNKRRNRNEI